MTSIDKTVLSLMFILVAIFLCFTLMGAVVELLNGHIGLGLLMYAGFSVVLYTVMWAAKTIKKIEKGNSH